MYGITALTTGVVKISFKIGHLEDLDFVEDPGLWRPLKAASLGNKNVA